MEKWYWVGWSLIGGALGCTVWAAIAYYTGYELGWIAWIIGGIVGAGAAQGVHDGLGGASGTARGVTAAVIAIASICGGMYAVFHLGYQEFQVELTDIALPDRDEILTAWMADEVVADWEEDDREIRWPPHSSYKDPNLKEFYPAEVWTEARARVEALTPEELEGLDEEVADVLASYEEALAILNEEITSEDFTDSFAPIDLLFLAFAVGTAFYLGSGQKDGVG